jgi:hypothetical protein
MRRSPLPAFRPRRVLAMAGVLSLGGGLLLLGTSAQPVQAAAAARAHIPSARALSAKWAALVKNERSAARSPAAKKQFEAQVKRLTAASRSSATVTGPRMYDPTTGGTYPPSSVTVTQTSSLVNQMVQVSWTNFTPSSQQVYNSQNVAYPVMVAECKGTTPSSPADCYGAENGGVTSTSGAFGPMNAAYATTGLASGPNGGAGLTDILILTTQENSFLGCGQNHPCSLAIVPAQGGKANVTPPDCADHTADNGPSGNATGGIAFNSADWACAWAKKIIVPLSFARSPTNCPIQGVQHPAFSTAGSPMLDRAMSSWQAGMCVGSHGMYVFYNPLIPEPLALTDLGGRSTDVAFTTRSANAQGISTGTKKYVYAPVAVSAVSIAYWFDNPVTGLPDTGINLDQRLLLKLLTQSYAYENDGCPPAFPNEPYGCDSGVDHNWFNLFQDPEFLALNPPFAGTTPQIFPPVASGIEIPTVQSGQSDMTWNVTSWIKANANAQQLLTGAYDPWGMHLNQHYQGVQYPNNQFIGQDPYIVIANYYNPQFPLINVATYQAENWYPATEPYKDPVTGNYDKLPPQVPGQRALIAITDQGDSAAFLFPSAALPSPACQLTNPARVVTKCHLVRPTTASMTAALQNMTSGGQGTKQVSYKSTDQDAYPLTMVIYAVVPTSGVSHGKAAAIARFLDFAAGAGQTPGVQPGQLPPGFAPLPANLRAQTRRDAYDVLHQTGAHPHSKSNNNNNTNNPGPSSGPSPGKSPGAVALPSVSPSPSATGNGVSLVSVADVHPASISRFILPALLILGGLAALAGSSSLIGSSSTPLSARVRRVRQGGVAWSRAARRRLGLRRGK